MSDLEKLRVARTALRRIKSMSGPVVAEIAKEALKVLGHERRENPNNDLCDGSQNDRCRWQSTRCEICPLFGREDVPS